VKADSGKWSNSPSMIMLNPLMVSLISTNTPFNPVNCSATWKGCDKKRYTTCSWTDNLSSSDNSSIPRIAMISCIWRFSLTLFVHNRDLIPKISG
jgi:hypothetical protein